VKTLLTVLALPILLGFSLPAAAQSGAQCAVVADDGERLACYDGLFRAGSAPASGESVTLQSQQLIPARPSGRAPATITVSCEVEGLQIAFGFAGNTMSALGRDTGLTLQYDLQRARSATYPVNDDNTAILINDPVDAQAFVDALEGATNLTVRVTPASTRSLNVRFGVSDFGEEVAPVVEGCGG
jgi:type VI secretion system protein VasI